ncbi:hypothetical protein J2752_000221 [Halarchaeum rubridurum]|uniref:Sulfatase n=1 Tax=Halarchaeum rubridurum TaxID=489911 RepID=A0A830FZ43_9EURY|nr:hypothetical protein [Halarchaeum rubridurum]MBP1953340.1 hypothetical protein [Halarchaeum rubridurum]GGM66079.1 hypothetical protein GCM10009017_15180 [Halarchaeum rubridurum]
MSIGWIRYAAEEISTHYDDPTWWRKRISQRVVSPVHSIYPGTTGIDVMDADWDTLVVLDACRADLFEEIADRDAVDDYRRVTSRASMTAEWTEKNFAGGSFGDTIYVTGNPYTSRIAGDAFYEVMDVWADNFDEDARTIRPEPIVAAAERAHSEHPDKRLIVHFMQPHYPFLGHPDLTYNSWNPGQIRGKSGSGENSHEVHSVWQALELGLVDRERVREAYADNLRRVLGPAFDLVASLDGRSVITADHGNLLGERAWPVPIRLYGHPRGVRAPELVEVPWAVVDGTRRDVIDEGTHQTEVSADVSERLKDLGYA